jgi:hypothetical protein
MPSIEGRIEYIMNTIENAIENDLGFVEFKNENSQVITPIKKWAESHGHHFRLDRDNSSSFSIIFNINEADLELQEEHEIYRDGEEFNRRFDVLVQHIINNMVQPIVL